jgi:hypothetical protein
MPRRFFDLFDDVYVPMRWHLTMRYDVRGRPRIRATGVKFTEIPCT